MTRVLDEAVWNWFTEQLSHPELIDAAYASYQAHSGVLNEQRTRQLDATKAALEDARDQEESYLLAVGSAKTDAMRARFVSLAEDAHQHLIELEEELVKLERSVRVEERDAAVIKAFAETAPQALKRLESATIEDKREALYRCKVQVTIWAKERNPQWEITWLRDYIQSRL